MATDAPSPSTDAPPANPGTHYENPSSKPLLGPARPDEREGVQRVTWRAFFVLLLAVAVVAVALGLRWHR